ncbi:MAG: alpha/beta hydrolase [Desulfobacterales bacterium]|nr:alpha/beta hydrolase [Desulfobacterales bacterium]
MEEYASAVADFMAAVGAPAPIPCGLSMGGAITQQLLLDHPGRFRAGIIVSSGARLRVLPSMFDLIATDMAGYAAMVDRLGFSPRTPEPVKRPFLADSLRARPEVAGGDFRACDRFDVMARLGEIRVPVLVVSAEDDRLTPPKYAEFLVQHIPGSSRVHIADAGHFVPIEKPHEVNAALARFLDAHGL